jgi:hypothetical protein
LNKVIRDLWILTEDGTAVFSRIYEQELKVQLFAMLMSALNSFAMEISTTGISNFELNNVRFDILKKNKMLFIATSSPKFKKKFILNELEIISKQFFEKYGYDISNNWDGEISKFTDFIKVVNKSVEKRVQSFLDNI